MEREEQLFAIRLRDVMVHAPKMARAEELGERGGVPHGDVTASWPCPSSTTAGALVGVVHLHDLLRAGAA